MLSGNQKEELMPRSLGKTALLLVAAGAVLFLLSASGQDNTFWKDGPGWLGAIGWFGFLICVLLLIVTGVVALARRVRERGDSVPH